MTAGATERPKQVQPCSCPWDCVVQAGQSWARERVVFEVRSVTAKRGEADADVVLVAVDWPHSRKETTASVLCGAGAEAWSRLLDDDETETSVFTKSFFNKTYVGLGPELK